MGQDFFYVIITNRHIFFRFTEHFVYGAHRFFQKIYRAFFFGNDFFPIPLVNIDGMDVVGLFVAADCAHIRIEAFSIGKSVFLQGEPFPFGQRMHDFRGGIILLFDAEYDRAFHAVQIIVQTGSRVNEQRCGNTQQMQAFRQ